MASDMSELIDKLNLGKVNVVGWSDGGNIGHASHLVPTENPDLINSEVIRFLKTPYRDIDRFYFFK
jgi:pimeloyl-ACP methyl ester carboxylesterase